MGQQVIAASAQNPGRHTRVARDEQKAHTETAMLTPGVYNISAKQFHQQETATDKKTTTKNTKENTYSPNSHTWEYLSGSSM